MAQRNFFSIAAALSGASAVSLGAYGAHGLRGTSDVYKEVWKTASFYHMIHTCGLGMSAYLFHGRKRSIVGSLFLAGIVLFSGSCYTVALMEERKPYGQLAPLGGFCLIFGWLAFGIL